MINSLHIYNPNQKHSLCKERHIFWVCALYTMPWYYIACLAQSVIKKLTVVVHVLQGLSFQIEILWRPSRPPKNTFFIMMKASVCFRGAVIWVSSTSFQKSDIDWPHQPPKEKLLKFNGIFMILSKKFFFQNNKICL